MTDPATVDHLVLVGMTGAGKSTVGRIVAERLGRRFVDLDAAIEARAGRTVRDIFAVDGESAFRDLEASTLADVLDAAEPVVVATGGGAVLRPENRAILSSPDRRVVWLMADPDVVLERVRAGMHRPLLDDDPRAALDRMWAERASLYQEVADAIVMIEGRSIAEVVEAVLR